MKVGRVLIVLASSIPLLLVPGHVGSAKESLPSLAAENIVNAVGPAWFLAKLDREVTIDYMDHRSWWTSFETDGSYAAVMIQELTPHRHLQALFYLRFSPPVGCSAQAGSDCRTIEHEWVSVHGNESGLPDLMTLEIGTYIVYALTDPGRSVTVQFRLPGLDGLANFTGQNAAEAHVSYETTNVGDVPIDDFVGKFSGTLAAPGLLLGRNWAVPSTFIAWHSMCFERPTGEGDALNTCGWPMREPEIYAQANGISIRAQAGEWVFGFRMIGVDFGFQPGAQLGAAAMWLAFADP